MTKSAPKPVSLHARMVDRMLTGTLLVQNVGVAVGRFEVMEPEASAADVVRAFVEASEIALDNARVAAEGGRFPRGVTPHTVADLLPHREFLAVYFAALHPDEALVGLAERFGLDPAAVDQIRASALGLMKALQ